MRKAIIGIIGAVMLGGSAMAQDASNLTIDTAGELAAVCSIKPGSADYSEALSFCYGYGHGAFQYYKVVAMANEADKFVCPPNPPPTRAEAWKGFLAWLKKNPKYNDKPAIDVLFRYLGQTYPCKN